MEKGSIFYGCKDSGEDWPFSVRGVIVFIVWILILSKHPGRDE
jgi:hypothetical protein